MAGYLIRRLFHTAVTLFFIALLTFILMHAVPGGPWDAQAGERGVSQQFIRTQDAYYGLDDPVVIQFGRYIGHLVQGDLGVSFALRGQPVTGLLRDKMKPSVILGIMSFSFVVLVGIPVGILTAVRKNSAWDYLGLGISTVLAAVPSFILAFLLLIVFAVWLDVFDVRLGRGFGDSIGSLKNGILPALALGAPAMALLARLTRGAMLEVLSQDYMRTAHAKGLGWGPVYLRHGVRNALIPVLTLLGPIFAGLITGSIVIEQIFGLPGVGRAFVTSIFQRDYGMIMGTTLLYATLIMLANLVVDFTYPLVDPRVRLS